MTDKTPQCCGGRLDNLNVAEAVAVQKSELTQSLIRADMTPLGSQRRRTEINYSQKTNVTNFNFNF